MSRAPSVASATHTSNEQSPFRCFSYATTHSPTLPWHCLTYKLPLHLCHLASSPCLIQQIIIMLVLTMSRRSSTLTVLLKSVNSWIKTYVLYVILSIICSKCCPFIMRPLLWSGGNIITSHTAGLGSIPSRVNFLVEVFPQS